MNKTHVIPVITIVGRSGSGKTNLMVFLIRELRNRGYRIGTVKHHSHAGFEIDQPGKDSWRHAQAGSQFVVVAAPDKVASYRFLERELELEEILRLFSGVDMILVEGFRKGDYPTIEVVNRDAQMISRPEKLIALVSDLQHNLSVPHFNLSESARLADFVEDRFLRPRLASSEVRV